MVALSCCSALFADELVRIEGDVPGRALYFGRVTEPLPEIADPEFNFRSCQLLAWAVEDLRPQLEAAFARYGSERVAIVLGASNTGVDEAENNIDQALDRSAEAPAPFPAAFRFSMLELGSPSAYLAQATGAKGPCYTIFSQIPFSVSDIRIVICIYNLIC